MKRQWKKGLIDCDFKINERDHERLIGNAIDGVTHQQVERIVERQNLKMRDFLKCELGMLIF